MALRDVEDAPKSTADGPFGVFTMIGANASSCRWVVSGEALRGGGTEGDREARLLCHWVVSGEALGGGTEGDRETQLLRLWVVPLVRGLSRE